MSNEPVAWMIYTLDGKSVCVTDNPANFTDQHKALPLYTQPIDDTALLRQALESLVAAGLSAHKTKQVREQAITALRERLGEST